MEREIVLDAPIDEVWLSLAEADWLGPDAAIDPRPAGDVRCGRRSGFVEEVQEPRRLVFWWSEGDEDASRVEMTLDDEDERTTVVRVVESRPLALLDLRGVDAVVGAPGPPAPEMSAAFALR
ncbi:MAG TPA: SRPBCC domain-containing protein [Thermoleophilaceae bacterium]|nr:SRPBCC domain-containing protein [Thermoleophilaceae bacterium]